MTPHHPYQQIAQVLRERIEGGQLKPGERLESRTDLASRFGVSGMTIHNAVTQLQLDGLVDRRQGKGVFVLSSEEREAVIRANEKSPISTLLIPLMLRLTEEVDREIGTGFANMTELLEQVLELLAETLRRFDDLARAGG